MALSDPDGILASPLMVISRVGGESDLDTILDLVRQHQVAYIVVGLPRSLSGDMGQQAEQVQDFVRELSERADISVDTWDERLSTVAAERMMIDAGIKGRKRKAQRDAAAAAVILQGSLDRMHAGNCENDLSDLGKNYYDSQNCHR